jgi:galactose-1-phosphate uridylyltransferase
MEIQFLEVFESTKNPFTSEWIIVDEDENKSALDYNNQTKQTMKIANRSVGK